MNDINPRAHLERSIEDIKRKLIKLGKMSAESLSKSVHALKSQDGELAGSVIKMDDNIDSLRYEIENDCLHFIARFQPLGEDLRAVSSCMYMASDLERLGDYGNSISKTAIGLADEEYIKPLIDIPRMFDIVEAMLEKSLEAFEKNSKDLAIEVFALDDQVDDLETQILRELVFLMIEKTSRIEQGSKLFLVARNLERAGDHVTNIAERVLYILTGEYVSASKYRRPEKKGRSEGF